MIFRKGKRDRPVGLITPNILPPYCQGLFDPGSNIQDQDKFAHGNLRAAGNHENKSNYFFLYQ